MYGKANSPLYNAFFSRDNIDEIQELIQEDVERITGVSIQRQDGRDLWNLMQSVYSVNSFNPQGDIHKQVQWMNSIVVRKCTSQVVTGLQMYKMYINDISLPIRPSALPKYTSNYGNKIPVGTKI